MSQLNALDLADMAPNEPTLHGYATACNDLKRAVTTWQTINAHDLVTFYALLTKNSLTPVAVVVPDLVAPTCAAATGRAVTKPTRANEDEGDGDDGDSDDQ